MAVLALRVHLDQTPELQPDDYMLLTIDLGDRETAYVQLTSNRLGIVADRIRQGDTDTIPVAGGARSLYSEGQAILVTTDSVIAKGKQGAAEVLEAAPADIGFDDGRFTIVGTDRGIDILRLAETQRQKAARGETATTLDAAEVAAIDFHTFPNGCHLAEVEVDPETGDVAVLRYLVCDDFGRAVNPLIVRGQVEDGAAQGFGQAVLERTAYDPDSGQLLSGTFMDYALPRADDLPDIEVELLEIPCATNPLGGEGFGRGWGGRQPAGIHERHHGRIGSGWGHPARHAGRPRNGSGRLSPRQPKPQDRKIVTECATVKPTRVMEGSIGS